MADPFDEIMRPLAVLRRRMEAVFGGQGLRAVHVGVVPGETTEGPHEVQVLAVLGDATGAGDDDGFARLVAEARDAELDARTEEAIKELKETMNRNEGFL